MLTSIASTLSSFEVDANFLHSPLVDEENQLSISTNDFTNIDHDLGIDFQGLLHVPDPATMQDENLGLVTNPSKSSVTKIQVPIDSVAHLGDHIDTAAAYESFEGLIDSVSSGKSFFR